jgi:hypothetical protein
MCQPVTCYRMSSNRLGHFGFPKPSLSGKPQTVRCRVIRSTVFRCHVARLFRKSSFPREKPHANPVSLRNAAGSLAYHDTVPKHELQVEPTGSGSHDGGPRHLCDAYNDPCGGCSATFQSCLFQIRIDCRAERRVRTLYGGYVLRAKLMDRIRRVRPRFERMSRFRPTRPESPRPASPGQCRLR